jgi:hypothetical protein
VDLKPLRDRNLKQNKNETKIFHYYYYYYYYYPSLCLSTDGRCFIIDDEVAAFVERGEHNSFRTGQGWIEDI